MSISQKDREILRDLARYQLELANSPRNRQLYADWMANGASKTQVTRPLINGIYSDRSGNVASTLAGMQSSVDEQIKKLVEAVKGE